MWWPRLCADTKGGDYPSSFFHKKHSIFQHCANLPASLCHRDSQIGSSRNLHCQKLMPALMSCYIIGHVRFNAFNTQHFHLLLLLFSICSLYPDTWAFKRTSWAIELWIPWFLLRCILHTALELIALWCFFWPPSASFPLWLYCLPIDRSEFAANSH